MIEDKKSSYTAASTFPIKLFLNKELLATITETRMIPPIHIQLNPTNKCNFNCSFCSCSNRDKTAELSRKDIIEIIDKAKSCGCLAITLTGGGEVLTHSEIEYIIWYIWTLRIKIGLVTNGVLLNKLSKTTLGYLTWCRISSGDTEEYTERGIQNEQYVKQLTRVVELGKDVDWAFSHVVSRNPNYETIKKIIDFANEHDFTHVRLVSDLLDLDAVDMNEVKKKLEDGGVDDSLVIYQGRKEFTPGAKKCYVSLLKPVITPTGHIVACCGWQYRHKEPSRDYDVSDNMGLAIDIDKLYENQAYFDGSECFRCYYSEYNNALATLLSEVKHKEFV